MKTVWLYLLVIAIVAIPLALFERWGIARFKVGWGDPLPETAWGKPLLTKLPFNLVDPRLLTRYHFVMFCVVVPTVAILIFKNWAAYPPTIWYAWAPLVIACILGVMELEDFLFFVFNSAFQTPYPHALARFFRGEANWHPRWIEFALVTAKGKKFFMLPDFYLEIPLAVAALLKFQSWLAR